MVDGVLTVLGVLIPPGELWLWDGGCWLTQAAVVSAPVPKAYGRLLECAEASLKAAATESCHMPGVMNEPTAYPTEDG